MAYDFCVSENTYAMAMRDERIKKMVTETAIEAVNRAFGAKLSLNFTTPRKTYVGPKTGPGVQAIKGKGKGKDAEQHTRTPGGRVAPLGGAGSVSVNDPDPSTTKASAFRFDDAVAGRPSRPSREAPASREPLGECEPKHALVHREDGKDMSKQFGRGSASREAEKRRDTRPSALVLRVDLPKLDSVADAELDVGDSRVFFCVPGKYKLDLALPYEVFGDEGKAKFDKAARRLEVTLPVKPMKMEPIGRSTEPTPEAAAAAETTTAPAPATSGLVTEIDAPSSSAKEDESDETGYVMVDAAEAKAAASAAAAVQAAKEFESRGETENQRRWREMHAKRDPPKPKPAEAAAEAETKQIVTAEKEAPAAEAAAAATTTEPAAPPPAPKAATMFLRPSLAGSSLDDELD